MHLMVIMWQPFYPNSQIWFWTHFLNTLQNSLFHRVKEASLCCGTKEDITIIIITHKSIIKDHLIVISHSLLKFQWLMNRLFHWHYWFFFFISPFLFSDMKAYIETIEPFGSKIVERFAILESVAKLHLVAPNQLATLIRETPLHTLPSSLLHKLIERREDYSPSWWGQILPKSFE